MSEKKVFALMQLTALALLAQLSAPVASVTDEQLRHATEGVLAQHGTQGCLLLYDESADLFVRSDADCTRQAVSPASTSKILNSLIALDEAVVADENEVVPWDGVDRQYEFWNADQTLTSALQRSAVWVYQWVARQLGRQTMQGWLDRVGYGNGVIGDRVDMFWLDGSLTITPEQQIHFLRRLASGDLPFSVRSQHTVRRILLRPAQTGTVLRAKSGWATSTEPDTGWYVGYLVRNDGSWFFALTVAIHDNGNGRDRHGILTEILGRVGVLATP